MINLSVNLSIDGTKVTWDASNFLRSIILDYQFNQFPRAKLSLALQDLSCINAKNLHVEISSDEFSTEFELGVDDISFTTNKDIVFQGYLCSQDKFTETHSSYLGDDAASAISQLGFEQELDINSTDNEYFQLNDTDVNCLLKILRGNGYQSIFTITEKSIKVHQISEIPNKVVSKYLPSLPISVQCDNQFSLDNSPLNGKYDIKTISESDVKSLEVASQYGYSLILPTHNSYDLNLVSNFIYDKGLNYKTTARFNYYVDLELGDYAIIPSTSIKLGKCIVTRVLRSITRDSISTEFELQSQEVLDDK